MRVYNEKYNDTSVEHKTFKDVKEGQLFVYRDTVRLKIASTLYRTNFNSNGDPVLERVNAIRLNEDSNGKPSGKASIFADETIVFSFPDAALYLRG